jgi:hypothetical protein
MTQTEVGPSVFAHLGDDGVFRRYHLRLEFRHSLHGGIPKIAAAMDGNADAETMIGQWIKATTGHYDRQAEEIAQATAAAMKAGAAVENAALLEAAQGEEDLDPDALLQQLIEDRASGAWTGFKFVDGSLVLEERQVKAMLKECGTTLDYFRLIRGFRQLVQHGVFVEPAFIPLMRNAGTVTEPDGFEDRVVHVMTAQGPRSAIKRVDYLRAPAHVEFDVLVAEPNKAVHWAQARSQSKKKESGQALPDNWEEAWQQMWRLAQELGLGANRSQGVGKFNVTRFDRA